MRRILAFLAVIALLLCGCGTPQTGNTTAVGTTTTTATTSVADTTTTAVTTTTSATSTETTQTTTLASGGATTMTTETSKTATTTTKPTTVQKQTTTRSASVAATTSTTKQTTTTTTTTTVTTTTTTAVQKPVTPVYEWQSHPEDFKLIAFGFDDLPTSTFNVTMAIDAVSKYEGFATCFVLGENVEKSGTSLLKYAVEKGFELGNHSYNHPRMKDTTLEENMEQLEKTNTLLKNLMGITPKWFRPPYLSTSTTLFASCFAADRMVVISGLKNSRTNTWYTVEDGANTAKACIDNAYDGAIYVMHPARADTAYAMEEVCRTLYNQGYRFCTISQLFEYKGITPQFNKAYTDVYG